MPFPLRLKGRKKSYGVRYSYDYAPGRVGGGQEINSVNDLKAVLRNGAYAWPGGYPLYFITNDGAALSFSTVLDELPRIMAAIKDRHDRSGWKVVGVDVNWEDDELYDDHTGEKIESAYGD
jgi:hypothetical protein